jgi:hypothetical protein
MQYISSTTASCSKSSQCIKSAHHTLFNPYPIFCIPRIGCKLSLISKPSSKVPYYDNDTLRCRYLSYNSPIAVHQLTMVFNQESPYTVHVIPPHSSAQPRTISQAARIVCSASLAEVDVTLPLGRFAKVHTQIHAHKQLCQPTATRPTWVKEEPITC